jgi:excisionase family DNA binding protein
LPNWCSKVNAEEAKAARLKKIMDMRDAGLTYAEISSKLGVSRERISQIINNKNHTKSNNSTPHPWLTTGEVSHLVNVHVNTVRRWANQGILKSYRVGPRGDRRFRRRDVNRLFRERITDQSNS